MGLLSFWKKNAKSADNGAEKEGENTLFLHITALGWYSLFQNANGTFLGAPEFQDNLDLELAGDTRTEAVVKSAVAANGKKLRKADRVHILLEVTSIQYTDSKPTDLTATSGVTIRQYGEKLLNTKDVTYGFVAFPVGIGQGDAKKIGMYAFADANMIRNTLTLFDQAGTKVREVVPKILPLTLCSFPRPQQTYGSVQMGAFNTTLVLVNPILNALLVRHFPVGMLTLIKAVSERLNVSPEDALNVLSEKDLVAEVDPAGDAANALQVGLAARALHAPLLELLGDLRESIEFFCEQRVAGKPAFLETFGASRRIRGLPEWLSKHIGIPIQPSGTSLLELFATQPRPIACNFLKGSDASLLTIGRTSFHFTEDRGFISSKELARQKALADPNKGKPKPASASQSGRNRSGSRRRPGSRRGGGRPGQPVGLMGQLNALFQKGGEQNQAEALYQEEAAQDRKHWALFSMLVFGLLFWGYSEYEMIEKRYRSSASSYLSARGENDQLKRTAQSGQRLISLKGSGDMTKILWSEKFLSLAALMDNNIWLSDVYLSSAQRQVSGAKVESTKMVVEGHVLPSTDGHIDKISRYIDRLLQDKYGFMSDFRTITFDGAELEEEESDAIIRFSFEAWYDKNKRLEMSEELAREEAKQLGEKPRQPGLKEMQKNIKDREETLKNLAPKGVR